MLMTSTDGYEFSLNLLGYQFPDNLNNKYDANWLVISIAVTAPKGSWTARGPYLLQWEAERLATWLEGMTKGAPFGARIGFIEPNLKFELVDQSVERMTLRIWFNAEFHPPWSEHYGASRLVDEGDFVDFQLSPKDLMMAARSMRSD